MICKIFGGLKTAPNNEDEYNVGGFSEFSRIGCDYNTIPDMAHQTQQYFSNNNTENTTKHDTRLTGSHH